MKIERVLLIPLIILIFVVSLLAAGFVLDVISYQDAKDVFTKVFLVVGIFTVASVVVKLLVSSKK